MDPSRACRASGVTDLAGARNADGDYPGLEFLSSILGSGGVLQNANLDALAGYSVTAGTGPDLTALEATVGGNIGTAAVERAHVLFSLYAKRPALRADIEARLATLGNSGDADDKETGRYYLAQCVNLKGSSQSREALAKSSRPRNAKEFLESKSPRRAMFIAIGKNIQTHGLTTVTHVEELYFDPESGKPMQKVEHSVHFSCPIELLHVWHIFVIMMQRLGMGKTTGWDGMTREVYTCLKTHGVAVTYDMIDQCLGKLDAKLIDNPVDLIATGSLFAVVHSLTAVQISQDSSSRGSATDKTKGKASEQVKLGACTKQGEFAARIKQKDGTARVCYNFNNGTPCRSGVNDPRYPADKGKCAFNHVCEVCGKSDNGKHGHPDCNK